MAQQHTLAGEVPLSGIGLHTGVEVKVRLCAAPPNTGIRFRRTDLNGFLIPAQARYVARVSYATSLMKDGVLISTTEHLLSALAGLGVDNALVEIDNLELPILDGSALPFVRLIEQAGLKPQRARRVYARVLKPVEIRDGEKRIAVFPAETLEIRYAIHFPHPVIGRQAVAFTLTRGNYASEIAPARTFGFLAEVEMLLKNGLVKGGSLENVVVLDRERVINAEGLRFPDEFCRHKLLDLVGDISLFGHPLLGRVVAERAGHAMHAQLVSEMLRRKDCWTLTTRPEAGRDTPLPAVPQLAATGA